MDDSTVYALTGLNPLSAISDRNYGAQALASTAGNSPDTHPQIWHPDHPMFWAGVVILAMFGLVGVSTSAKAGPIKAGVSLGGTK